MTAFTCNTGGIENWDTKSGGSVNATLDSYAISNGTTLLIDTDSYQCANHGSTFGSLDTVTFSGSGGTLKIDGTNVRVIPYNTGSGNVPAIGTTISQGGVSATLLGVWSGWQAEPTAVGAAMPASGFIKVKNKTGGSYAAGALTGIGASATGADVVGWIEVRGADTATITVPRIGRFEVTGDWFELGTTTGVRGQVLACPTTATVAGVFPGVWIETSAGSGVYERFNSVGSMVNLSTNPTDERGKVVWQTTSGIRIGSDGTNNVGYLPSSGCKVRIPNVILTCCTRTAGSGSGPRVLPNSTLGTRQEFVTTAAGDIDIDKAVFQWYGNFLQAYRADVTNSAWNDTLILQEIASPINVDNVIVSPTQTQLNNALNMVSCFGGGTFQNANLARFSLAASGAYVCVCNYVTGVTFSNVKSRTLLNRGNASTGCWNSTQAVNCTWTGCMNIGGQFAAVGHQGSTFTNHVHIDQFSGTTGTTNAHYAFTFSTGSNNITIDGVTFGGLTNLQPYSGLVSYTASYNLLMKNIGTYASKLSLGSTNASAVIFNSGGNNDGITLKRVYTTNTRTGLWATVNSDNNFLAEHVYGDYADTTVIAALNAKLKNCGLTGSTTGQTSVYGTHWETRFTSTTAGFMEILCNEPTAASAAQCAISSGTPQFNSAGQLLATAVGQAVTWETDWWVLGYTAFTNTAPTITGTNVTYSSGARWGNHDIEYQIDTGSGWNGTWKALTAANLSAETITATPGFKLKVRVTCATASSTNAITNMRIAMTTTDAAQGNNLYPLATVPITVTVKDATDLSVVENARVRIVATSGGPAPVDTVILEGITNASGVLTGTTEYTAQPISGRVRRASDAFGTIYKPGSIVGEVETTGFATTVLLIRD